VRGDKRANGRCDLLPKPGKHLRIIADRDERADTVLNRQLRKLLVPRLRA